MSFENRRYKMVGPKLEKRWDGINTDGWCKTKAEAYAAVEPPKQEGTMPEEKMPEIPVSLKRKKNDAS